MPSMAGSRNCQKRPLLRFNAEPPRALGIPRYLKTPMIPVTVPTTPLTVASFADAPVQMPLVLSRQPSDHQSRPNFCHAFPA